MTTAAATSAPPPLNTVLHLRRRHFNRLFAAVYLIALLSHLYHHIHALLFRPKTLTSILTTLALLFSDTILGYMWTTTQAFRMNPIHRRAYPENLDEIITESEKFPALDVFICTADPYKEPPMGVASTALSVMAYDYPTEKISVYVSDDGASEMTMFAFMEAAKFGKVWLPFCKENNVVERCPEAYFGSYPSSAKAVEIKAMYESMKIKVEKAVENGKVDDEYISSEEQLQILDQYRNKNFTGQNHPSIIQVLLDSRKDRDTKGSNMPNLIYVSREKSSSSPHHFKAGALNALLRVSATMTNSPIILTLDCDMYSNDPSTPRQALCYFLDEKLNNSKCGYVQFPQRYHGLNENDIYGCELKRMFFINPHGLNGLRGPDYFGTGCFFSRRAFFGGPSSYVEPEMKELGPMHAVDKPISKPDVLRLAHHVVGCNYEILTKWGYKTGFRYGSLVEDFYTGYQLQCEGWRSIYCNPNRAAFLGYAPISLLDSLNQMKRWVVGLFEVAFSKLSPLTYGVRHIGILMAQAYAHYALSPILSLPIMFYAFIPSLSLLIRVNIFPKVNDVWLFLYVFLFLGAYGQDFLDFMLEHGTLQRWWSDQRMWLIRGMSCYLFGSIEYLAKHLGIPSSGFNVTSKVDEEEQSKRYEKGIFEFGTDSPMFLPLTSAAILNFIAFIVGIFNAFREEETLSVSFLQISIACFGVLNSLPFYEAMVLRSDSGRIPTKTTITSLMIVGVLYGIAYAIL